MQIYVGKNGQQLGPFSLEEINRKLAEGTFAGSDLAWYEGAASWAPLSSVAGVVVPQAAAAAPTPTPARAPTPSPASVTPAPVPAPMRPNTSIVQPARRPHRALAVVSWVLLGITFVVSLIPLIGCGAWAIGIPVAIAAIIMGILILNRGATGQGIMVILGGVLIVPLCFLGQFASLGLFASMFDSPKKLVILSNLQTIDTAKSQFATQTNAASGTPVTMAGLTSYLSGKEIKAAVGETYDPMPIGQTPTATLPASKSLGKFKGGEVLTAEQLQKDIENSFISWTSKTTTSSDSPTPAATLTATPRSSSQAATAPSETPSPKPSESPKASVSPKSSVVPHLISPRQSVEPEDSPSRRPSDSPSSRPSPSAKFAPRNPRQSPSPSGKNSQSEKSGGPQTGRQFPRETPGATPEKSPSDDDE
jgi:hypothetical protein